MLLSDGFVLDFSLENVVCHMSSLRMMLFTYTLHRERDPVSIGSMLYAPRDLAEMNYSPTV